MAPNLFFKLYGPIYGSLYFSTMLSTAFYGVTCMQTFFYYVHYRNDPWHTKGIVAIICAFNTIHEALTIAGTYKCFMAGLANQGSVFNGVPELVIQLAFTSVVAVATQGFFVYRIYIFNGKHIAVPLIYIPLGIYQLVATLIYVRKGLYSADGVRVVSLSEFQDHLFTAMAVSCLSVAAAADVLISAFLTYLLLNKRSNTSYVGTAYILQRLVVFAVNAGIWTTAFAFLSVIFLHVYPMNMVYAVFAFPLCSVYCNTLLANLNARAYLRGEAMTRNTEMDLFMDSTSRGSEATRPRVVSFRSAKFSEGLGAVKLSSMSPNPPMTSPSESACA